MAVSDSLIKMANDRVENSLDGEYLVRGAVLKCSYGDQQCVLNLLQDHGCYIQGIPQINTQDSGVDNIENFGRCKKNNYMLCTPLLTSWYGGNSTNQIWDNNTLTMTSTATASDSVAYCITGEGEVDSVSSGQSFSLPSQARVYLSSDKKAIVIDEVNYEIYNPNSGDNGEDWYTIGTYSMTERDFDLSKAFFGFSIELEDFTRQEVSNFGYGTVFDSKNNPQPIFSKDSYVGKTTEPGSLESNTALGAFAMTLAVDVLKNLANAVEYTTVYFYFQETDNNKYRVVILGGTKTDFWKYIYYDYYERERSYIYHVMADDNRREITKRELKPVIEELIRTFYSKIKDGKSNAELLVEEDEIPLKKNEFYDLCIYLNKKRRGKIHQIYLYTDNGELCQKHVTYPNDSLAFIKRRSRWGSTTRVLEMIDATDTLSGNYKLYKIFEKVLQDNIDIYLSASLGAGLADPSNATPSNSRVVSFKNTTSRKKQSISDLINSGA